MRPSSSTDLPFPEFRITNKTRMEPDMHHSANWYFDFISPFSYLQFKTFQRLPDSLDVRLVPILFAGLLNHWEQKGPAEIPRKRTDTYQYCHWYAERHGILFTTPPAHPFNPLKSLRLAIAQNTTHEVVDLIFNYIWGEGKDAHTEKGFHQLTLDANIPNANDLISSASVKDDLRQNTEQAIALGVYGVPTFAVNNALFWGLDRTDMMLDYLENPNVLTTSEMRRLSTLPKAVERRL